MQGTGGVPTSSGLGPAVLHQEWALSRGTLPPGLVRENGVVLGTPVVSGAYVVGLLLLDGAGDHTTGNFRLTVSS